MSETHNQEVQTKLGNQSIEGGERTYWDLVKRDLRLEVDVITGRREDAFHG